MKTYFSLRSCKMDTRTVDVDPLEECRSLLRQQNEETAAQRYIRNCFRVPSRFTWGYGIMVCLLISTVLFLVIEINSSNRNAEEAALNFPEFFENEVYCCNKSQETTLFLEEWKKSEKLLKDGREKLLNLYSKVSPEGGAPSYNRMELYFSRKDTQHIQLVECALILESVKKNMKKCINMDVLPEGCLHMMRDPIQCDPDHPYRTMNGTCNNLRNPTWGMKGSSYLRLMKPHYSDDVSSFRKSVTGKELPNARLLSSRIYDRKLLPDAETTMMFMNFGLFLDHDLLNSLLPAKDIHIRCCDPAVKADPRLRHPSCAEVYIPEDDPFYIKRNITCLDFYRNVPAIGKCPGRREQLSVQTSFIDLSDTYGASDQESHKLRAFKGGQLRHAFVGHSEVLPSTNGTEELCYRREAKYKCFSSGDIRANLHVELMVLHTLWMREHNRIAEQLQLINPQWSDEKLFQEARKINIAEFQHIAYNEFLPNLLGKQLMEEYDLDIDPYEEYDGYDETAHSGVYNSFSSAGFRFGHTLVQSVWEFRGPDYKITSRLPLHELYTNPAIIYHEGIDDVIRGMVSQRTLQPDRYTTKEVRDRLFQRYYTDFGLDLTMTTIQRGRDCGLPSYTRWRKFCGLEEIRSWDDMSKFMDDIRVDELRKMYISVDDVDLAPGGLSEYHLEGALIGPTYACIIKRQFKNTRISDRFWFENRNQAGSFTPNQLAQIYQSNFARILCDTADDLQTVQRIPFRITSKENPVVSCDTLPVVDLSYWAEDQNS